MVGSRGIEVRWCVCVCVCVCVCASVVMENGAWLQGRRGRRGSDGFSGFPGFPVSLIVNHW